MGRNYIFAKRKTGRGQPKMLIRTPLCKILGTGLTQEPCNDHFSLQKLKKGKEEEEEEVEEVGAWLQVFTFFTSDNVICQ